MMRGISSTLAWVRMASADSGARIWTSTAGPAVAGSGQALRGGLARLRRQARLGRRMFAVVGIG
jgi:hypothetical protein